MQPTHRRRIRTNACAQRQGGARNFGPCTWCCLGIFCGRGSWQISICGLVKENQCLSRNMFPSSFFASSKTHSQRHPTFRCVGVRSRGSRCVHQMHRCARTSCSEVGEGSERVICSLYSLRLRVSRSFGHVACHSAALGRCFNMTSICVAVP